MRRCLEPRSGGAEELSPWRQPWGRERRSPLNSPFSLRSPAPEGAEASPALANAAPAERATERHKGVAETSRSAGGKRMRRNKDYADSRRFSGGGEARTPGSAEICVIFVRRYFALGPTGSEADVPHSGRRR